MDRELVLFNFNIVASSLGLVVLCVALGQFAYVEYKLYLCKQKLYKENNRCIYNQL